MAISFIGSTGGSAINGNGVTLTLPGTWKTGDVAVVALTLGTSKATALSVASSSGGAFTQIVATITSSRTRFGVFRQVMSSTLSVQAVITGTGGSTDSTSGVVHVFSGLERPPEDVTPTSTTGNSTSPDSPSITVNSCGCAILTSVGFGSVNALTAPSSFLQATTASGADTAPCRTSQAYIISASTAAFDPAVWTSTGVAAGWCSATIALERSLDWAGVFGGGPDTASDVDRTKFISIESY